MKQSANPNAGNRKLENAIAMLRALQVRGRFFGEVRITFRHGDVERVHVTHSLDMEKDTEPHTLDSAGTV